jgi:DNA-directed RNA polymerase subunit D
MARNAIKVLTDKGNTTHILIKGTNTATLNALRRTILSEVPVLAIEELSIYENNGVLFDEFLGHRMGMVPLITDPKSYKLGDKVKISLDVTGPGMVYSRDIHVVDEAVKVADERIPLAKLKAGQRIRMEGDAVMGQGKDHVKYQPGVVGFRALPVFTINESIPSEIMQRIAQSCPVNIIEVKGKKLNITQEADCTLCGHCEEVGGSSNIQVDADDTGFTLMLETHGGLSNKDILHQSCNILVEKTKGFLSQIEEGL